MSEGGKRASGMSESGKRAAAHEADLARLGHAPRVTEPRELCGAAAGRVSQAPWVDGTEGGQEVSGKGPIEERAGVMLGAALPGLSDTNGRLRLGEVGRSEVGESADQGNAETGEGSRQGAARSDGEAGTNASAACAALAAQVVAAEAEAEATMRSGELVCVRRSEMRELLLTVQQLRAARGQEAARLVRARAALGELLELARCEAPGSTALRERERELVHEGLL
jgi:hypothetical protein